MKKKTAGQWQLQSDSRSTALALGHLLKMVISDTALVQES